MTTDHEDANDIESEPIFANVIVSGLRLSTIIPGLSDDTATWKSMQFIFDYTLRLVRWKIPIWIKIEKFDICDDGISTKL